MAVIVIRYEATTTARWASFFSIRTFFHDAITVAIWTGFHVRLMRMLSCACYHTLLGRAAMASA